VDRRADNTDMSDAATVLVVDDDERCVFVDSSIRKA
jgi:hypothetical protein